MYYSISKFLENWNRQVVITAEVLAAIPEHAVEKDGFSGLRKLDRLAYHITQGMVQIGVNAGLFSGPELSQDPLPERIADSLRLYFFHHHQMARAVQNSWNDEMLTEEIEMYRQKFRRGDALSLLERHEQHHRSQITMIMDLLDLRVPNLYLHVPVREKLIHRSSINS
ncbi:DinB family protein [Mucilaginibacter lutimaris]|uniref:DinB family protein n=1 Tax=Mucilaginibacter lutimaris TaxID=931629 RepID=A0ABW2ZEF2_9SPHI